MTLRSSARELAPPTDGQVGLPFRRSRRVPDHHVFILGSKPLSVRITRHPRARRYLIRVEPDGSVRLTLPRGGSLAEARTWVRHHRAWIEEERYRATLGRASRTRWRHGDTILFRGGEVVLTVSPTDSGGVVSFAGHLVRVADGTEDLKPDVLRYLRALARHELVDRLLELAGEHGIEVRDVTVRNQRSRWGSCSATGRISLNWRLVQMPVAVRDYVLLHELMHVRQPDHSRRFWALVEAACPGHREARAWLKAHQQDLV